MFTVTMTAEWLVWVSALAAVLHGRLAWRMANVFTGILLASGRRTASSWWRAARVGARFRSYYYFLDAVGRKAHAVAAVLVRIVLGQITAGDRLVFALDDTPTKRYGPKVQGAGIHHNPTPGPAGAKFLYGHSWVALSRIVRHACFGLISLPLLAVIPVRKNDISLLPPSAALEFQTTVEQAAELARWLRAQLPASAPPAWIVVDGGYAKREFLKTAKRERFVVVARLRRDAA